MCRGCRKVANWTWQRPCSHGTYQHEAITSRSRQLLMMGTWLPETCWATSRREIKNTKVITSRSRQLLMMGTWLPETCWATSRREIKNTKVTSSWFFLSTLLYISVPPHFINSLPTTYIFMEFHTSRIYWHVSLAYKFGQNRAKISTNSQE